MADENVIGEFTPFTYRITCQREPEVGIAWMACINELGICALGDTPKAAASICSRRSRSVGTASSTRGTARALKRQDRRGGRSAAPKTKGQPMAETDVECVRRWLLERHRRPSDHITDEAIQAVIDRAKEFANRRRNMGIGTSWVVVAAEWLIEAETPSAESGGSE